MTWEELEKRLCYYLYEKSDHTIWGKFSNGDKILNLHGVIHLCKNCFEVNDGKGNMDTL
jgi:hypothetical protein